MDQVTEVFAEILALAERRGVTRINDLPGCWEVQADERWFFAVNGGREARKCSHGVEVEPFTAYVEYNGFPAGIVTPRSGILAAGSEANEGAFIAALRAAS